jgi:hypothetical protein
MRPRWALPTVGALVAGLGAAADPPLDARGTTPTAPAPAVACTAAPRAIDDLLVLTAAAPRVLDVRQELPAGVPLDAKTADEITQAVRHLEACANTGDIFRFMALFTDAALARVPLAADPEARAELVAMAAATPTPSPVGQRAAFAGPWRLERLPDGRVLAAVVWFGHEDDACIDPNRIEALILAEQAGQWLIDERIEAVAAGEMIDLVGLPPSVGVACAEPPRPAVPNDD